LATALTTQPLVLLRKSPFQTRVEIRANRADGSTLLRAFVADTLLEADFKVFETCSADEAMTLLEARRDIDLVLTDVEMPGSMNGIAAARAISQHWPHIAVIVMSDCAAVISETLPRGMDLISKPFNPDDPLDRIRRLITQSRNIAKEHLRK
jgi:two-component system, response regulator PdtaR